MISTVGLFGIALLLAGVAGVVLEALLAPSRGFRLRPRTPAVGFGACVVLLVPLGSVWPTSRTAWALVGILILSAGLSVALVLRAGSRNPAPRPVATAGDGSAAVLLASTVAVALLALSPLLRLGFPTTIAAANNDGWSYAGMTAWLQDHSWTASLGETHTVSDIFGGVLDMQVEAGFGIGFESFASSVATLTGYPTYATVQAVAALLFVVAGAGWFDLGSLLVPRLATSRLVFLCLPASAPALITAYSENYLPHAVGLALVPAALAALIRWFSRPSAVSLVIAAVIVGAILSVYPGVSPWVIGPWGLLIAWTGFTALRSRIAGSDNRALGRAAILALAPIVAVAVIAPFQASQTVTFLTRLASGAPVPYPELGGFGRTALFVGASGPTSFLGPLDGFTAILAIAGFVVILAGLGFLVTSWRGNHGAVLAMLGVTIVSSVSLVRFSSLPDFAYGVFKVLLNSGYLAAGFAMLGLLLASARWQAPIALAVAGALGVMWMFASSSVLASALTGGAGFRAPDITAGRHLSTLGKDDVILLEGASATGEAFHQRMAMAYFSQQVAGRDVIGLGTTGSYFASPGSDAWRPSIPWDYVLADGSEAMTAARRLVWANGTYSYWRAPQVDATPYGVNWYSPEGSPGEPFRWTGGPVEILVSNRGTRPTRVEVSTKVLAWGRPRRVELRRGSVLIASVRVGTDEQATLVGRTTIPPRTVTVLTLDGGDGMPAPPPDPRLLSVRVDEPRVVVLRGGEAPAAAEPAGQRGPGPGTSKSS